ncbi:MAG: pyruvate kinase [Erysipelotrichaceae bacterium]
MLKRTKIVCTIGPASEAPEMLEKLMDAGMNVARLNFSHGDHQEHGARIENIRNIEKTKGKAIGIMLDTKGPEIRCGIIENDEIKVQVGDVIKVVKEEVIGNKERFHLQCPEVFDDLEVGDFLLIDDGKVRLDITDITKGVSATCKVFNAGSIKTRKGVNVPNVKLSMPFISSKDDSDIRFGCKSGVDYIAASFVRRAKDIDAIRDILIDEGCHNIRIIAKIENQEGYDNLDEILQTADAVMVARGDLGVEVSTALVPIYQKKIIKKANEYGKAVITATHMLDSMTNNPRPTRAEASDVSNAVFDGTDCVMLSGESAAGLYPLETVKTMATIAKSVEENLDHRLILDKAIASSTDSIQDAIGASVSNACLTIDKVKAIVAFTQGGSTARRISKFRPNVPIIAVTFTKETLHNLSLSWGVIPVLSDIQNNMNNDDYLASKYALEFGCQVGDYIIITAGYPTGEGTANMMKIIEIK